MTICVLDFYRFSSPRGVPFKQFSQWTTSSTSPITITPSLSHVTFVKYISFLIDKEADLGSFAIEITHNNDTFGGVESNTISYSSIDNLIAGFAPGTTKEIGCNIKGHITWDIPLLVEDTDTDIVTISYTGSGLAGGQINIVASGWDITPATNL